MTPGQARDIAARIMPLIRADWEAGAIPRTVATWPSWAGYIIDETDRYMIPAGWQPPAEDPDPNVIGEADRQYDLIAAATSALMAAEASAYYDALTEGTSR